MTFKYKQLKIFWKLKIGIQDKNSAIKRPIKLEILTNNCPNLIEKRLFGTYQMFQVYKSELR